MMRTSYFYQQGAGRRSGGLFRFGSYRCPASSAPFAGLLALLLILSVTASCSDLDIRVDTGHSIQLSVYSDVSTKGASGGPVAGTDFPDNRLILLSAHYTDPRGEHTQNLFRDITFSKYGSPAVWQAGTASSPNAKFWPFWGTMDFIAVTRATTGGGASLAGLISHPQNSNVAARIRYDMPDNSSLQDDVMFAFAGGRDCEVHENIPMVFRHAQAQVAVSAAANVNTANTGVSIRGIYLCNAKFSGLVEATPSGTDNITFSWSDVDGPVDAVPFWVASGAAQRLSVQPAPMGRGILVPEQSPAGTVSIRIDFTVHNGVKADGTTPDNTDLSYMYTIPSGNWLAGKKYQYVFTIGLSEITCEATVSETWDTSVSIPEVTL